MGWRAKTGREQEVLDSIVSTLLALAALAEQAAGRSPWVRWCVLWAARQADLITRDYVAGSAWNEAGRLWSPVLPMVRYGTDPDDAIDLAASLRALAMIVSGMAAYLRRASFWQQGETSDEAGHDSRPLHDTARHLAEAAAFPVARVDTS